MNERSLPSTLTYLPTLQYYKLCNFTYEYITTLLNFTTIRYIRVYVQYIQT